MPDKFGQHLKFDTANVPGETAHLTGQSPPLQATVVVNEANMVPANGKSNISLQFTYEAANWKLFYTWETLWKRVVDVTWNGGKYVKGSTTENDGKMGGVPEFQMGVEDKHRLERGPGSVLK